MEQIQGCGISTKIKEISLFFFLNAICTVCATVVTQLTTAGKFKQTAPRSKQFFVLETTIHVYVQTQPGSLNYYPCFTVQRLFVLQEWIKALNKREAAALPGKEETADFLNAVTALGS